MYIIFIGIVCLLQLKDGTKIFFSFSISPIIIISFSLSLIFNLDFFENKINHDFLVCRFFLIFRIKKKIVFSDSNHHHLKTTHSTNDVYEIDYSDYDDQETESSQASGNLEKLNKSLRGENNSSKTTNNNNNNKIVSNKESSSSNNKSNNSNVMDDDEIDGKSYIKEHYMSNSDNEMDEIDYRYHSKSNNDKSSKINQIIEEYKIETATINHHRSHGIDSPSSSSHQLNNSKGKSSSSVTTPPSATTKQLNQSTNPVIKNYLKAKEHDFDNFHHQHHQHHHSNNSNNHHHNNNNRVTITTSNKKLNDLSKKSKNLREMTKPKIPNMSSMVAAAYSTVKSTTTKPTTLQQQQQQQSSSSSSSLNVSGGGVGCGSGSSVVGIMTSTNDKMKKPKSPSASSIYTRQDSSLNEFQIEKVVSWMSVNEENFSEFEFSMMGGSGGQVNENKSLNERSTKSGDEHDSTYQEIVDIIKEIEHEKKDSEDFKTLKTDVEFKLNTILNSIESPDDEIPPNDSNDDEMSSTNKLK